MTDKKRDKQFIFLLLFLQNKISAMGERDNSRKTRIDGMKGISSISRKLCFIVSCILSMYQTSNHYSKIYLFSPFSIYEISQKFSLKDISFLCWNKKQNESPSQMNVTLQDLSLSVNNNAKKFLYPFSLLLFLKLSVISNYFHH